MKRARIICLFLAIAAFLSLTAFENDRDFEISVGKNYIYCYDDESFDDIIVRLNKMYEDGVSVSDESPYTAATLKRYFKDNNIEFFAVNKTNNSQIRVAVHSDSISEAIQNLSEKSNKTINRFAKDLVAGTKQKYKIYYRDAKKYVMISNKESDNGGDYYVTQFITICNGSYFNISFFTDKKITSKEKKILDTFEVKEATFPSKKPVYIVIFCAVTVGLLVCLVIYMLWGVLIKKKPKVKHDDKNSQQSELQTEAKN